MRETVRQIFEKIGTTFISIGRYVYKSEQEKRVVQWFKDQGDKTHRLIYDLNENSIVFDLGGYEGQWASDIFSMYQSNVYIFEPVNEFAEKIKKRFSKNSKISTYDFGLSRETKRMTISINGDASSLFKEGKENAEIKLVKAIEFFNKNNINGIDLMKINIEGGEYDLLEHLIETGYIKNIKSIQVQFHDFFPNVEQRMLKIQNDLKKTHTLTYQYPFVWENWKIEDDAL